MAIFNSYVKLPPCRYIQTKQKTNILPSSSGNRFIHPHPGASPRSEKQLPRQKPHEEDHQRMVQIHLRLRGAWYFFATKNLGKLQKKITNLNLAASYGDDVPQTNHDFQWGRTVRSWLNLPRKKAQNGWCVTAGYHHFLRKKMVKSHDDPQVLITIWRNPYSTI